MTDSKKNNILSIIVAIDGNNAIGKNNDLLTSLPKDMKRFKDKTINNIVVMGRKTFDSFPDKYKPLPNRDNIIITRDKDYKMSGCKVVYSIEECLEYLNEKYQSKEIFIIGGGDIYKQFINIVDKMYVTHIDNIFQDANIYFPEIDKNN
ncbi:MAG: dihydrofolate reductase [Cyanobium sp. MAG06]|nr:dihydrofolate reductase [Cyanobium sp. MAG06]